MSDVITRLDQRALFKGDRAFVIQNDGKVSATYSGPGLKQELTLQLAGINPNDVHQKHVATDMIVGFCIFMIPTLGFLWGAIKTRFGSEPFYWFTGTTLLFMLPLGLCWREYVRRSFDLIVFTEPMTGNRLVILRSVPDLSLVDKFVTTLRAEMQKARDAAQFASGTANATLSAEIERLASLRDRGILSDAEFQQAKTSLLSGNDGRRMGFHG